MLISEVQLLGSGLVFPEGPVALPDGSVLLVEIRAGFLSRVFGGEVERVADCGLWPNGAAIGPDGKVYVCNSGGPPEGHRGGSIQRVDLETGEVEELYADCGGHRLSAPNDLVFDSSGKFWFTDQGKIRDRDRDRGGIYYASPDGSSIEEALYPLDAPNGIGLSPDGGTLYWAETFTRRLFERTLPLMSEPIDLVSPAGLVCALAENRQFDSFAVDSEGNVCAGTIGVGGITVITPGEGSVEHVAIPHPYEDPFVTNICFGGSDMSTAFITLGSTGRLISCRWPRPGLRLAF